MVYMLSAELREVHGSGECPESAVLDVIENQLFNVLPKRDHFSRKTLIQKIVEKPGVIASMFSNIDAQKKSIIKLVVGEGE
jgi:hypothetical protein